MGDDRTKDALRLLTKGGAVVFVGQFLEQGISFLAKVIIAQALGKVDYGSVAFGVATLTFASTVTILGMKPGIGRFLPRSDDERHKRGVVKSAFEISLPVTLLVAVLIFVFADDLSHLVVKDSSLTGILKLSALGIPFRNVYKLSVGGVQGSKKTVPKVLMQNITVPVTRLVTILVAVGLGYGALGAMFAYTAAFVAAGLLGIFYLKRYTRLFSVGPRKHLHSKLLVFSAPLVVNGIMGKVLADMDTFLIGYYVSTGEVGVYNVVYPVALLLLTVLMSLGFLFMPLLSEFHSNNNYGDMRRFYQMTTKWIFLVTLPMYMVLTLYPKAIIGSTFGGEFTEGGLALIILSTGFLFHTLLGPNDKTLATVGRTKFVMLATLIAAVLNLAMNVVLIPDYSYVGAAVATAVSYVVMNAITSAYLYHVTDIHPFSAALLKPATAAIAAFVMLYAVVRTLLPNTILVAVAAFATYGVLYATIVVRFGGIEEEEIQLLEDIEHKFDVDLEPVKEIARRVM